MHGQILAFTRGDDGVAGPTMVVDVSDIDAAATAIAALGVVVGSHPQDAPGAPTAPSDAPPDPSPVVGAIGEPPAPEAPPEAPPAPLEGSPPPEPAPAAPVPSDGAIGTPAAPPTIDDRVGSLEIRVTTLEQRVQPT